MLKVRIKIRTQHDHVVQAIPSPVRAQPTDETPTNQPSAQADGGGGGGGVLDMVGDAPQLSSIPDRGAGGGAKSSPTGSAASGGGVAAAAAAGAGSFMKGAMGFFSPASLARHKKLLDAEDQRREASLDIMGESSEIIAALKAEVRGEGSGGAGWGGVHVFFRFSC